MIDIQTQIDPNVAWGRPAETVTVEVVGKPRQFPWGRWDAFGTAAHWAWRATSGDYLDRVERHTAVTSLASELVFALLGGFGVRAELAHAAQVALDEAAVLVPGTTASEIEAVLREPLPGGRGGRIVRYRFPVQRSVRLAEAVGRLSTEPVPGDPAAMRTWLESFRGVGPKTSAWVVRNVTGSDDVAIIDIWIARACRVAGVFDREWRPDRDYEVMEAAFVGYARAAGIRTSVLDLCIWEQARLHPRLLGSA